MNYWVVVNFQNICFVFIYNESIKFTLTVMQAKLLFGKRKPVVRFLIVVDTGKLSSQ